LNVIVKGDQQLSRRTRQARAKLEARAKERLEREIAEHRANQTGGAGREDGGGGKSPAAAPCTTARGAATQGSDQSG
jgi:hypothetical protein